MGKNPFYDHFKEEIEDRESKKGNIKEPKDIINTNWDKVRAAKQKYSPMVMELLEQLRLAKYPERHKCVSPKNLSVPAIDWDNLAYCDNDWRLVEIIPDPGSNDDAVKHVSVVGVDLTFDSFNNPTGFTCYRVNRKIKCELSESALIDALITLYKPTQRKLLINQYDDIVKRAFFDATGQEPHSPFDIRYKNDPNAELTKYMPGYLGDWDIGHIACDPIRFLHYQPDIMVRLRLGTDGKPINFQSQGFGKVIETDLSYHKLKGSIKKIYDLKIAREKEEKRKK